MAKGVIVVDVPERCIECELMCTDQHGNNFCFIIGFDELIEDDKPDWCPIKPLPEKMDYQSRHGLLQEQIMVGWNMCIDAILKGGEIDE